MVGAVLIAMALGAGMGFLGYKCRRWFGFWRRRKPVMLRLASQSSQRVTQRTEGGGTSVSTLYTPELEIIDGPYKGLKGASVLQTNPPFHNETRDYAGFYDPRTGRIESHRSLWVVYGTMGLAFLVLGVLFILAVLAIVGHTGGTGL